MIVISKTCKNCVFWQSRHGVYKDFGAHGECRKRPPGHVAIDGRPGHAPMLIAFPPTAETDWCSEFDQARTVE